ncbi:MAG: DUF1919 domain-containing protein [Selenomonadaceae bacterium]|nr:DUF1919 domain-containing protein [Selenomonadaceae bacterium]
MSQKYGTLEISGAVYMNERNLSLIGQSIPPIDKNTLRSIDYDIVLVTEIDNSFGLVLEEARRLNLDTNKFILDRTCAHGFSLELYQKLKKSKLSIISMNGFGALIGKTFGLPNVGMNFSFSEENFLKFLRNPFGYLNSELNLVRIDSSIKILLKDIELKINYGDINSALDAWENWGKNFNPFNSLVVMYTEKPKILAEFDNLPYAKKICFVPFETDLESGFYIKPYYVGGRSFETAVNKIAMNQIVCFNIWDILLKAKKTPINLHSKSRNKEIKAGTSFSSPNGKINFYNWWAKSYPNFLSNIIQNYVGNDKVFNIFSVFGDHRFVRTCNVENKIFFTGEEVFNWTWYEGYEDYCLNDVDLALGFEHFKNENYLRFPLWLMYIFESKLDIDLIKNKIAKINAAHSTCKYECVLINSHDTMNTRTPIYNELKNILQIKCAGKWNNNTDELKTVYGNDKRKYVHEFRFNICPENVNRFGYVTEKIFDAFLSGSIPIYYGSDNNPEEGIINKDAVLFWNPDSDNDALIKEVIRLNTDENYYEKFMRQEKLHSKNAVEYVYSTFEELIRRLKEM